MNSRTRTLAAWLVVLSSLSALAEEPEVRKTLVCSTTQVADFARQVVGDRMDVKCVLKAGQDPHIYQVTPNDVRLVKTADLCLSNGWHLEGADWMKNLANDANKHLVECVNGVESMILNASGQEVKDPHAWFTPKNAAIYVRNILRGVTEIDPDHAEEYERRTELYLRQLQTLHAWITKQVSTVPPARRILVTSHDAFGYFCQAYGFQSAAPAGWSTGTEVGGGITPARRKATVDSIRNFGVRTIFVETSVNPELIREIAKEAGVNVDTSHSGALYSDSMGEAGSAGETYMGMMRENVLKIVHGLTAD